MEILEADIIKQGEMKEKLKRIYQDKEKAIRNQIILQEP